MHTGGRLPGKQLSREETLGPGGQQGDLEPAMLPCSKECQQQEGWDSSAWLLHVCIIT